MADISNKILEWSLHPLADKCEYIAHFKEGKLYPSEITFIVTSMCINVSNDSNGNPDMKQLPHVPDHITTLSINFNNNRVFKSNDKKRSLVGKQQQQPNVKKRKQDNDND
ncbi:hypothetical protein CYY_008371, partial [Polysphondylium violaceum]